MTRPFELDADPARAATPPPSFYTDPELQVRLRERVLARSWHWIADEQDLPPGSVRPVELLPGCLDEPLVLTRDEDGVPRLLSNVCTHRAALVCDHAGPRRELRCRYHGRRFGLDGRLLHAPEFEGAEDFPRPSDDLPRVALGRFGPLLFASLDPAVTFDDWLGPLRARLAPFPWERCRLVQEGTADYDVKAHWALYCENYLEGFHIPYVHPGLARVLDWTAYEVETFPGGSLQIALAAEGEPTLDLPPGHPDHGRAIAAYYAWLFPGTMLNVYPWGLSLNAVQPTGPDRCRVRFRRHVWEPGLLEQGAGAGLDQVEREDEEVVESVQRGLRSRLYSRGRYAPRHEVAVHHFHRALLEAL